jgi:tetratricopeptide (TPR) repeat protein
MLRGTLYSAVAGVAILFGSVALAQGPVPAKVHGKVTDPAGGPVSKGEVKFTTDKTSDAKDRKYPFSFPLDAQGNYTATGLPPGDYLASVFQGATQADYQLVTLKAGDDKTVDFDMTREEYMKSLSPEDRKQIEEFKKKNASVASANAVIAKLNATLVTVRADLKAAAPTKGDVSADVTSMKSAVDAKADVGLLWITYGDALQAQGDHLVAEDKKASKPSMSDEEVLKAYGDAADAYKKGIDLDNAGAKPNLAEAATADNQLGTTLAKMGNISDSSAAFEAAVKLDPTKAGMYYNNEAAILFNASQGDAAVAAADKAIAADPNRADPYFIKGQALIAKSTFDNKTQKLTPPPGCVESYQKFLELAPNDPKAPGVKEVLASLGEKIDTKFRAPSKK